MKDSESFLCLVTAFSGVVYYSFEDNVLLSGDPLTCPINTYVLNVEGGLNLVVSDENGNLRFLCSKIDDGDFYFADKHSACVVEIKEVHADGIGLFSNGKYLTCNSHNKVSFSSLNNDRWEAFGLIAKNSLDFFLSTTENSWIDGNSGEQVYFGGFYVEGRNTFINCGAFKCRLSGRPGPIVVKTARKHKIIILDSFFGKKYLYRYNPLVYFTVGGASKYYECCGIAVNSLRNFCEYSGDILIISDMGFHDTISFINQEYRKSITVKKNKSDNVLFSRYDIFSYEIDDYNPIVYLDTDIISSGSIDSILNHACRSDYLHLYRERHPDEEIQTLSNFSYEDWTVGANWWGAWLFGRDGEIGNEIFYGTTSGIMIFQNTDEIQCAFSGIIQTSKITRTHEMNWFGDQPFLSYVSTQMQLVDISLLQGKSVNSGDLSVLFQDRTRILKHISLGVGRAEEKNEIMKILYSHLENEKCD